MKNIIGKVKRAINSPEKIPLNIIYRLPFFHLMNDKSYLKLLFWITYNKKLNLSNPKTFNEKINWLKLFDRKDIYTTMVDKYLAKDYVANIIGREYIIPTIGVYNSFDEIDINKLPDEFVIKNNHDSGNVFICKNKKNFNFIIAKRKLSKSLKKDFYYINREWPYKNIKHKIIIEKYMKDINSDDLTDYKFYCFNGEPKYLYVSNGLSDHTKTKMDFLDINYNRAIFGRKDYKHFEKIPPKPKNYSKMIELAKILSKDIPFLRVDFYEVNKKIYFGELTFSPCGGFMKFYPSDWDEKLGDMLDLSKV